MTVHASGKWDILETLGTAPTLIASNLQARFWKPIHNEFRGKELELVKALIFTTIEQMKTTQSLFTSFTQPKIFYAIPVLGPQRQVHGINLWQGPTDTEISTPPAVNAWNVHFEQDEPYVEFPHGKKSLRNILEKSVGSLTEVIKIYDLIDSLEPGERAEGEIHFSTQKVMLENTRELLLENSLECADTEKIVTIRYIVQAHQTFLGRNIQGMSYLLTENVANRKNLDEQLLAWLIAQESRTFVLRQKSTEKIRLIVGKHSRPDHSVLQPTQEKITEIIAEYAGIDTELIVVSASD